MAQDNGKKKKSVQIINPGTRSQLEQIGALPPPPDAPAAGKSFLDQIRDLTTRKNKK